MRDAGRVYLASMGIYMFDRDVLPKAHAAFKAVFVSPFRWDTIRCVVHVAPRARPGDIVEKGEQRTVCLTLYAVNFPHLMQHRVVIVIAVDEPRICWRAIGERFKTG